MESPLGWDCQTLFVFLKICKLALCGWWDADSCRSTKPERKITLLGSWPEPLTDMGWGGGQEAWPLGQPHVHTGRMNLKEEVQNMSPQNILHSTPLQYILPQNILHCNIFCNAIYIYCIGMLIILGWKHLRKSGCSQGLWPPILHHYRSYNFLREGFPP